MLKERPGMVLLLSITIEDGNNKINIYPESIILKNRSFNETVIRPDLISIESYENNYSERTVAILSEDGFEEKW